MQDRKAAAKARLDKKIGAWEKTNSTSSNAQAQPKSASQSSIPMHSKEDTKKDNEIALLKQQLRKANAREQDRQSRQERQQRVETNVQDDQAINDMEHGNDARPQGKDVFDKTYHLHYINPASGERRPYNLHFVVRPATFADQNAISGEVTMLTNRLGKYYEINNYDLVEAFANFRVLGIKVPAAFKDPKKLYRPDILEMVYLDFLGWERKFRQYHMD